MPGGLQLVRYGTAALALALAAMFIGVAIAYWALPADSLPSWLPGHKLSSHPHHGHHHKRHGLVSLFLGLLSLAVARLLLRRELRPRGPRGA
jgi:hypothetical protein